MEKILSLAIGSMAGGFARWSLSEFVRRFTGEGLPYGTLLVNLAGCFLIGLLYNAGEARFSLSPQGRMLLVVGFCGAFTTFSTWILEASQLMDKGGHLGALAYVSASIVLGLMLFRVGAGTAGLLRSQVALSEPPIPAVEVLSERTES